MKKLVLALAVLSLIGLGGACVPGGSGGSGGNGNGNGNGDGGTTSAEQFAEQFRQDYFGAICKSAFQCPQDQSPLLIFFFFSGVETQEECVEEFAQTESDIGFTATAQDIEAGRTEFDSATAQSCLNAIDQAASGSACDIAFGTTPIPESCVTAFQGQLENGENCSRHTQCQSGRCNESAIAGECYGECEPAALVGEACRTSTGEGNENDPECRGDLACAPDGEGGFACVEYGSLDQGDPCVGFGLGCGPGLACQESGGDQLTCQPISIIPSGSTFNVDTDVCEPGTICRDGTCQAAGEDGTTCSDNFECSAGYYCDSEGSGTCVATKPAGESCEFESECQNNLECTDATCTEPELCQLP